MRKIMKKISLAIAFLVCFALVIPFVPNARVFATEPTATSGYVEEIHQIKIENFQKEGFKGGKYKIKSASTDDPTDDITIKVTNPYGKEVEINSDNEFTPKYMGKYTVTYTYKGYSKDMFVMVGENEEDYEIRLAENDKYIIPSIVNPNNGGQNLEVVLPNAIVVDSEGNQKTNTTVEISVAGNCYPLDTITSGDDKDHKKLTFNKDKSYTYKVTYKEKDGIAQKVVIIKTDKGYKNDYELVYDYNATKPETAVIGKELELPTITAKNKETSDKVESYYDVTASYVKGSTTKEYKLGDDDKVITFKDGKFYFTPILDGNYTINYKVIDFFGHEKTSSFEIKNVKDSIAPTPVVTLPYDKTTITDENYVNAEEALASYTKKENILLMPIYATDNANGIVEDNLTLYRTIKDANNTEIFNEKNLKDAEGNKIDTTNKILVFNSILGEGVPPEVYIKGEKITLEDNQIYVVSKSVDEENVLNPGTYTISYIADDKGETSIATETYTMKIVSDIGENKAPTVKFVEDLPKTMFKNDKITFAQPTASDEDGHDTRLSTYVTYKIGGAEFKLNENNDKAKLTFDKDKKEYTFEVLDNTVTEVKIIAHSRDDNGAIGSNEQIIKVLNTGDNTPVNIESVDLLGDDITVEDLVQGKDIILPTVVYTDDLIDYVNINIAIKNGDTIFEAHDAEIMRNDDKVTISNAKFNASLDGEYTITYTATDSGNNVCISVFTLNVRTDYSTCNPHFVGLGSEINGGKAEVGDKIALPIPTIETGSEDLIGDYQVTVFGDTTNYELDGNYFFTAYTTGIYKIKYVGNIKMADSTSEFPEGVPKKIESNEFIIEVVDTKAPEFSNFNEVKDYYDNLATEQGETSVKLNTEVEIKLPESKSLDFSAEKSYVTISPEYFGKIYFNGIDNLKKTFSKNSTYTITYTLVDYNDNSVSESFKLDVGDVIPPEVEVKDGFINETYKIGDTLTIDLEKITATDLVDGELIAYDTENNKYKIVKKSGKPSNPKLTLTVKNKTTSAVLENKLDSKEDDLRFAYDITTAGEYVVTLEISDTSSHVTTKDFTFTVSSPENTGIDGEEVLGIVLIVVSVLLLGGVVTYFIVTRKSYKKF